MTGWADVATKHDVAAVRQEIATLRREIHDLGDRLTNVFEAKFERRLGGLTPSFVTWLLAAQASTVALVIAALAILP